MYTRLKIIATITELPSFTLSLSLFLSPFLSLFLFFFPPFSLSLSLSLFQIFLYFSIFQKKDQSAAEGDKTEGEEDADKTESDDKEKPADASEDKPEGEREYYIRIKLLTIAGRKEILN